MLYCLMTVVLFSYFFCSDSFGLWHVRMIIYTKLKKKSLQIFQFDLSCLTDIGLQETVLDYLNGALLLTSAVLHVYYVQSAK